jgi:hypothetical protein
MDSLTMVIDNTLRVLKFQPIFENRNFNFGIFFFHFAQNYIFRPVLVLTQKLKHFKPKLSCFAILKLYNKMFSFSLSFIRQSIYQIDFKTYSPK